MGLLRDVLGEGREGLVQTFPEAFAPLPKLTSDSEVCSVKQILIVLNKNLKSDSRG